MGVENHGVKPLDFPLLSDENIAPDVVHGLRARGSDLRTAWEEQLIGRPDVDVLAHLHGKLVAASKAERGAIHTDDEG